MKTLFVPLIGRFGNILFIYCHARAWCEQNGYELSLPPWVGEQVFSIPLAVRPNEHAPDLVWGENLRQNQASLIYTRKQVREWLKLKPHIEGQLQAVKCQCEVLLNVRMGSDYTRAGLVTLSKECYGHAAALAGYSPDDMAFETDINPARLPAFDGNLDASGLGTTWAGLPSFYRLMTAPVLFRANSSFSFWAATLGHGKIYSPVIRGLEGGKPDVYCNHFVEGNWPAMTDCPDNSDLHLPE